MTYFLILYLVLGGFISITMALITSENEEESNGEFYARGINTVFFWPLLIIALLTHDDTEE